MAQDHERRALSIENQTKMSVLLALRNMLRDMERDVGLDTLSAVEKDVYLAANAVTFKEGQAVSSEQIRRHALAAELAQATYHRSLRSLLALGLLEKAFGYKAGWYVVRSSEDAS
jgi:hypothetical protein